MTSENQLLETMQKVSAEIHANTKITPTWVMVGSPELVRILLHDIKGLFDGEELTEAGLEFIHEHGDLETREEVNAWWRGELVGPLRLNSRKGGA